MNEAVYINGAISKSYFLAQSSPDKSLYFDVSDDSGTLLEFSSSLCVLTHI